MDLITKQDRALPLILEPLLRLLDDFANARHAFGHGRKSLEMPFGVVGDDLGERRLTGARRPPEDARPDVPAADQVTQRSPRAEQMLLAEELVECLRPHPRGEGLAGPLEQCWFGHDSLSTSVLVSKNTPAPAKNAAGIVQPCLPCSSGTRFDAATYNPTPAEIASPCWTRNPTRSVVIT